MLHRVLKNRIALAAPELYINLMVLLYVMLPAALFILIR